jgi:hypothetical protein
VKRTKVANILISKGVILGRVKYIIEYYIQLGPDSQYTACQKQRHLLDKYPTPSNLKYGFYAKGYLTEYHKCSLIGYTNNKGYTYLHRTKVAHCANYRGNYFAASRICEYKKATIHLAYAACLLPTIDR